MNTLEYSDNGQVGSRLFRVLLFAFHVTRLSFREYPHSIISTPNSSPLPQFLVSGSDDCALGLWSSDTRKCLGMLRTGHSNNIFHARFVPGTNNSQAVSLAADGEVSWVLPGSRLFRRACSFDIPAARPFASLATLLLPLSLFRDFWAITVRLGSASRHFAGRPPPPLDCRSCRCWHRLP